MPKKTKTHSLRFTSEEWKALQIKADLLGYSGPNAFISAIARDEIPVTTSPQQYPDLRLVVQTLQHRIEGLHDYIRGVLPTDLP